MKKILDIKTPIPVFMYFAYKIVSSNFFRDIFDMESFSM